ncbi:MAG: ABC transporter substrate-binding protein [Ignavibacteriales bacterium]
MYNSARKAGPLIIVLGLVVMVIAIIHSLTVSTSGPPGRSFRLGLMGQALTLDPVLLDTHADKLAASSMYESLLCFDDKTHSLIPGLAYNWGYAKDGRSVVFSLKGNVYFHNGKRMTAEDVRQSWEKAVKTVPDQAVYRLFENITGVDEYVNGSTDSIIGLKVIDAYTIRVYLDKRDSSFVYKIINPAFWIVDTGDPVQIPAGTGPYKLAAFDPQKGLLVHLNRGYHGQKPAITSLQFILYPDAAEGLKAYKTGQLDYLDSIPLEEVDKLAGDKSLGRLIKEPVLGFYAIAMNVRDSPFNQMEFRRSLSYGIDRDLLIKSVMGGVGKSAKGLLPIGIRGYNRALQGYSYNPETADELLNETTYLDVVNPQTLRLTYNEDPGHKKMMEAVQSQLETMGINILTVPVPWKDFQTKATAMNYSFFRFGWEADYPDIDNFLYPLFHSSQIGVTNLTGYSNPMVDRLLDQARAQTSSTSKRIQLLRKAEQIIIDDAPMIWLFQKEAVKLVAPDVQGFEMDGMEMIDWSGLSFRESGTKKAS